MKDWKKKVQILACLLPAAAVFVCMFLSLRAYVKPTFQVEAVGTDEVGESEQTESATEKPLVTTKPKVNIKKTVTLPSTSEQETNSESESKSTKNSAKTEDSDSSTDGYEDGTYYGTGTGFEGEIKVKVTIKKGKINKIEIVKSQDGESYLESASALLSKIIKKQSTNVDTVSGATYSSNGLIEAVRAALKKAEKKSKQSDKKTNKNTDKAASDTDKTEDKNTEKNTDNKGEASGSFPYKDGIYFGTGEGYRDDITVAVCISDHAIQYIMITEAADDTVFLSKAKSILTTVMQKQSTDVDVVSGATYSSKGIIEAIKNALAEAKKATDGQTNLPSQTAAPTSTPSPTAVPSSGTVNPETLVYANGEYQADAVCSPDSDGDFDAYTLSLKITIENDLITSVTDVKGSGALYDSYNDWYINRAVNGTGKYPGVTGQIVSKGNCEGIDAVSGATCSSNAIMEAVKKALESAKK
jgi:uncharacterized protein with FMN-binding domain